MALLPANATGKEKEKDGPFGLTVMGTAVTEENKDDILGDGTKSMSYDPETRVLRLENLTLEDTTDDTTIASSGTLTIEVIGKNTIATESSAIKISVLEAKGFVFEGDGSLDVNAAVSTHGTFAILAQDYDSKAEGNGIEINGPAITATSGGAFRGGSAAVSATGSITVNSGALKGKTSPTTGGSSGIFTHDNPHC